MNSSTDLPQILIGELGRTMGVFLAWYKKFKRKFSFQAKLGSQASHIYLETTTSNHNLSQ